MEAINLDKAIENLKKCYIGKKSGTYTLDKSKIGSLFFDIAAMRVSKAVKSGEITEKALLKRIRK